MREWEGHVAAARKKSHQWRVSLTPNNTKTIGRMTCYCFLRPIRRDLTNSSYTTRVEWGGVTTQYLIGWMESSFFIITCGSGAPASFFAGEAGQQCAKHHGTNGQNLQQTIELTTSRPSVNVCLIVISLRRSGRVIFQNVSWLLSVCATYACNKVPWKGYLVLKNKEINKTSRNVENWAELHNQTNVMSSASK